MTTSVIISVISNVFRFQDVISAVFYYNLVKIQEASKLQSYKSIKDVIKDPKDVLFNEQSKSNTYYSNLI